MKNKLDINFFKLNFKNTIQDKPNGKKYKKNVCVCIYKTITLLYSKNTKL